MILYAITHVRGGHGGSDKFASVACTCRCVLILMRKRIASQRREQKKKEGMFSKMISNHISTDFNG